MCLYVCLCDCVCVEVVMRWCLYANLCVFGVSGGAGLYVWVCEECAFM